MKYEAKLPKKNVNISHENPLKELFTLLLGVLLIFVLIYKILDFSLDLLIPKISYKTEKKIFSAFGEDIYGKEDKKLQELVDGLSKCANMPYALKVRVTQSEDLNAFAYPGGQIVVFSALVKKAKSQNSLAFVLAHEIGHFKNRDHLRAMGKSLVMSVLISMATNESSSGFFDYLNHIVQTKYSREHESQADKIALEVLNCYYGHVGGSDEFFKSINKKSSIFSYLSTHPPTKERIENLHKLTKENNYKIKPTNKMWE